MTGGHIISVEFSLRHMSSYLKLKITKTDKNQMTVNVPAPCYAPGKFFALAESNSTKPFTNICPEVEQNVSKLRHIILNFHRLKAILRLEYTASFGEINLMLIK